MKAPVVVAPSPLALPKEPFRGIEFFRYIDSPIFFARDDESAKLVRLVTIYRGALLYGDSGSGKSSLINARFLPDIIAEGFRPDRIRVQPRAGEEFIIERMSLTTGNQPPFLPSNFAPEEAREPRIVLSTAAFLQVLATAASASGNAYPLLIFDQFEELVTQFEEAPSGREVLAAARDVQKQIVSAIVQLLRDQTLRVKLLFVFREDYLAKVHRLFVRHPDLADRYLRLTPPRVEALERIIRGPFTEHPGHFAREISPDLAGELQTAIGERCESGRLNLSEVQIACLRLWQSADPEKLFAERGVAGLLEDYSLDAVNRLSEQDRDAAIAVLASLVTSSGTRNIVSGDDLIRRLTEEEKCSTGTAQRALAALVTEARLVRREMRHDTAFYEIVSEFLIPWILRQKAERRVEQERLETERRLESARLESERTLRGERDAAERRRAEAEVKSVQQKRQQLKYGMWVLSVMVLLLLTALAYASSQAARANKEAERTKVSAANAEKAREEETGARKIADQQRDLAKAAAAEAQVARAEADKAKAATEAALKDALEARTAAELALAGIQKQVQDFTATLTLQLSKTNGDPKQKTENPEFLKGIEPLARALADLSGSSTSLARTLYEPYQQHAPGESPSRLLAGHTDSIWTAAISPADGRVATASADKTVRVWNADGDVKAILLASTSAGGATCAAFSPDGKFLVTGSAGEAVRVFNVATQAQVPVYASHRDTVTAVSYSPDGGKILSASADRTAKLWTADNQVAGKRVALANWAHPRIVTAAGFSADGRWVVTSCDDGALRVWDASLTGNAKPIREEKLGAPTRRAVFSPVSGSPRLAAASGNNLVLWEAEGTAPARVCTGHTGGVIRLAFSPDGNWVVTAGADGAAFLWNAADGSKGVPLPVQQRGRVLCVAWGAGKVIATCGEDGTVELWDGANPQEPKRITILREHTGPVWYAAFTRDGRHLVTTSATTQKNADLPSATGKAAETLAGLRVASDNTARLWDVSALARERSAVLTPASAVEGE